jgi:trimeric autotransporter adhesin
MLSKLLRGRLITAFLLPLGVAPAALAQVVPFNVSVQSANSNVLVENGSTLTLPASNVGQSASFTITLTYEGQTSAAVSTPQLNGPTPPVFTLSSTASSASLMPGQAFSFSVTYTAANAAQATGQLTIPYTEASATTNGASTAGSIFFTLVGTAPQLIVTYALSSNGNVVTVTSGSTIPFPSTVVGTSTSAQIGIINRGSGSGMIQASGITLSGDPSFTLQSGPLTPLTLAANGSVAFNVVYAPSQTGTNNGMLQIVLSTQTVNLGLQGTAIASLLSYQLVQGTQMTPLMPGQTLTFPNTNVGSSSSLTILAQNTSSTAVTISGAAATGTGYSITDEPILPVVVNVNQTISFTVTFMPTQPGVATGRFRVGNDSFNLTGNAIGVQLVYSFTSGSASNTVLPMGIVSFAPLTVGQSESTTFTIQNSGTSPATITSVGVSTGQTVFTIPNPPQTPLTLNAGQSTQFQITFGPQATGLATGTLVVDDQTFTLSGFGNSPPTIPSYQFTGASGTQAPDSQVSVGLSLSSPYSLPLTGKLVISVNSGSLPADPSVQFSTGGETVDFTIAKGATEAIFASGANQIGLQTGTVAETITITPSFATAANGTDLTPTNPPALTLSVPTGPVQLVNALVSQATADSITLEVIGYTTTRTLTQMQFQFTSASTATLANNTVSLNIQSYAQAWFSSTTSQSSGGMFSITVPFSLSSSATSSSSGTSAPTPLSMLQSVSITVSNELGTSSPVVVTITQ